MLTESSGAGSIPISTIVVQYIVHHMQPEFQIHSQQMLEQLIAHF